MAQSKKFNSVKDYFDAQPLETKGTLLELRKIIIKNLPDAEELFNYEMPAYTLVKGGKRDKQIMIAGYKNFVGFYVGNNILFNFTDELKGYVVGKASVQFPNNKTLPEDLIAKIINYKVRLIG